MGKVLNKFTFYESLKEQCLKLGIPNLNEALWPGSYVQKKHISSHVKLGDGSDSKFFDKDRRLEMLRNFVLTLAAVCKEEESIIQKQSYFASSCVVLNYIIMLYIAEDSLSL